MKLKYRKNLLQMFHGKHKKRHQKEQHQALRQQETAEMVAVVRQKNQQRIHHVNLVVLGRVA